MMDKRTARAFARLQAAMGATPAGLPARAMLVPPLEAWALVHGHWEADAWQAKAERRWPRYVGRIGIYAGVRMPRRTYEEQRRLMERWLGVECPMPADIPRGCIVGTIGCRITFGGEPRPCEPVAVKLHGSGLWVRHERSLKTPRWMSAPRQLDMLDWIETHPAQEPWGIIGGDVL